MSNFDIKVLPNDTTLVEIESPNSEDIITIQNTSSEVNLSVVQDDIIEISHTTQEIIEVQDVFEEIITITESPQEGTGGGGSDGEDGLSAYELAVQEGFVGTLEEWLASLQGEDGTDGAAAQTYESVSKNLNSHPYQLNYSSGILTSIVYDLGGGSSITKTLTYSSGVLTSITLSGDTPDGIELTKTLGYTGSNLTSVAYS